MVYRQIETEIDNFINGDIEISEGYRFSQYKLIKRIMFYANGIYPKGKTDKQGNYKYWTDIISPRIDSEIKNIDFDTKDIMLYSDSEKDYGTILLLNLRLKEWLRENNKAVELNDDIEYGSGWGNIVWKKVKGGYERVDLKNFYLTNPTAQTLAETAVIERHSMTQSDLRKKEGVWKNVQEVIDDCGNKYFSATPDGIDQKETPYYEIFERNGEISEKSLLEAQGKTGGDENKYILAKIILAGLSKSRKDKEKHVLFAEEIPEMPYKEYHRGRYSGRWFRVGIYELLIDIQTRGNEISNQIARGLDWASKTLFRSKDRLLANNILTDLKNGDVVKSEDLQQINVRMEGLDQLIADWNRLMVLADKLCNSYEVVQGETGPSGTPFRTTSLLNQNANKLFDFLREKLALALQDVFQDWILPEMMKDLKRKDVLRITGDGELMDRYYKIIVNAWYIRNLVSLPPHSKDIGEAIKSEKEKELKEKPEQFIKAEKGWLDNVKPRVYISITGENVNLQQELDTLATFIGLEQDPIRRTALIEKAMKRKGIDIESLPRTEQPTAPTVESLLSAGK